MGAAHIVQGLVDSGSVVKSFEITDDQIAAVEQEIPSSIKLVPQTMKIHQVTSIERSRIRSRILSCQLPNDCQLDCDCFSPNETTFVDQVAPQRAPCSLDDSPQTPVDSAISSEQDVAASKNAAGLKPVEDVCESLVGQYCVVLYTYDGLPYPCVILSVDEDDVEVKTMGRIGKNRWFWPMIEDVIWYDKGGGGIITMLGEPPVPVTKRYHKLPDPIWSNEMQLNI